MKFKEFFHKIVSEDGIDSLELKGDWNNDKAHGWDKPSRKLLTNPIGVERIRRLWSKTSQMFDIYLLKGPKVHNQTQVGRVDYEYVRNTLGLDIPHNPDNITIIFTNNKGSERIPATPWTLAHRFGHALTRVNGQGGKSYAYDELERHVFYMINEIAQDYYGIDLPSLQQTDYIQASKIKKEICQAIGTFKSARDRVIRNEFEFVFELIAQYIVTGTIKFKTDLPSILPVKMAWGKSQGPHRINMDEETKADLTAMMGRFGRDIYYYVEQVIEDGIGNIYVM